MRLPCNNISIVTFALALSSPGITHLGRIISIICVVGEPLLPSKTQPSELRHRGLNMPRHRQIFWDWAWYSWWLGFLAGTWQTEGLTHFLAWAAPQPQYIVIRCMVGFKVEERRALRRWGKECWKWFDMLVCGVTGYTEIISLLHQCKVISLFNICSFFFDISHEDATKVLQGNWLLCSSGCVTSLWLKTVKRKFLTRKCADVNSKCGVILCLLKALYLILFSFWFITRKGVKGRRKRPKTHPNSHL